MVKMQQTSFNMCGFIQPTFILNMLGGNDPDAFNDRQFFVCPEEVEYMYAELKVPMDPTVSRLEDIFRRLKHVHKDKHTYKFDDAAQAIFIEAHDKLCRRKMNIPDDEDRRGILSKAKGQLARMAVVVDALEQAIAKPLPRSCMDEDDDDSWEDTIGEHSVVQAEHIMNYIIDQKFALMKEEVKVADLPEEKLTTDSNIINNHPRYLSKFLTFKNSDIQASDVSQFRLMPPTPKTPTDPGTKPRNKYPVEQCKNYMQEVSKAGFGTLHEVQRGGLRKALVFRKRRYNELGSDQIELLKRLKVNEESYSASQMSSDSLASTSTSEDTSLDASGSDEESFQQGPALI